MKSILGILGSSFGGSWIVYLVIAAAVFGAGSAAGYKARGIFDAPVIAGLKGDVANAKADTQKAVAALAEQQRVTAEDAAKANAVALAQQQALQGQVADLTSKLAQTDKARREASARLLDSLKAIPHDQQATLSASVRAYLLGVRDQQAGTRTTSPNGDHEDGLPMAGRATGVP